MWQSILLSTSVLLTLIVTIKSEDEPSVYILDFPTENNPLNISISSASSKNYFMLIGDWGAESDTDKDVQKSVADKMISLYNKRKDDGYNLLFIATVGDNFYYDGQTCDYYTDRWTDIYGELTDYPWLAVFGNHDWGQSDPDAMCAWGATNIKYIDSTTGIPYAANQINSDKGGCNPKNYYLPDFGYYYRIDELSFELLFLEESYIICPDDMGDQSYDDCQNSYKIGCNYLHKMANASELMLIERSKESTNNNFLIIQHYPENSDRLLSLFKENRPKNINYNKYNSNNDIVWSAYGHTHRQECIHYSDDNKTICDSILTGGGSGCCSEDTLRGFFVIDFNDKNEMIQAYKYDDQQISCQYPCKNQTEWKKLFTKEQIEKSQFQHCCHQMNKNSTKCDKFDMNSC